jgi:uncharacterized protein (TIGR03435 family)
MVLSAGAGFGQTTTAATVAPAPQTASGNLTFDVASVRPAPPLDMVKLQADMQAGKMPRFGAHVDASRAEYNYMSLKELIANAYKVKPYQITGPDWLNVQRFNIVATLPNGASKDDAPKMLQALLEERFKLKVHRDTQEHPVLGLVVAKGGPKLKESPGDAPPIDPDAPLKPGEMKVDGPEGPIRVMRNKDGSTTVNMGAKGIITQRMDMQAKTMNLESSKLTMDGFAEQLTSVMQMGGGGRQVVNMTDLKGDYQVAVEISLAGLIAMAQAQGVNVPGGGGGAAGATATEAADPGGAGTTVFSSVEKLGLKLEPRKAKVEQLIVDSAEKNPTDN